MCKLGSVVIKNILYVAIVNKINITYIIVST